jgi:NNP family nitrate/nitrite transporter-like MFS transporter
MASQKATRIALFSFATPPMRAFHLTWMAFFVCFFAWFACAPLMPVIKGEFGLSGASGEHQYRGRRHHHPRAPDRRTAVRPLWPAQDLHGLAAAGRHPVLGVAASQSYESFLFFRLASAPSVPASSSRNITPP